MLTPRDEKSLVARSLAGDGRAYAALIEAFSRPVFSLLLRLTANAADSEDLAQEVFVRAYSGLHTYDPSYPFLNWILTIAHNEGVDWLKARSRAPLSLDDEDNPVEVNAPGSDAAQLAEAAWTNEAIWRATAKLQPPQREALLLRHKDGLDYQAIAEVMGLPLGTVKTLIHRGRLALRKELAGFETFQ